MKQETNQSEIILYKTDDGRIKVDTVLPLGDNQQLDFNKITF